MDNEQIDQLTDEQLNFHLILHSGNARSNIIQSLKEFRVGHYENVKQLLKEAENDLKKAHEHHFHMIQKEASGDKKEFSLLLIHAEDHLMSTITMNELVIELLEIFKSREQS